MTSSPLSILHLVSSERWTGVADPVISAAKEQSAQGHDVYLACIGGYTFEEQARQNGVRILTTLKMDRRLYPKNLHDDYRELRRLVEEQNIEVIHTHLLHDNWLAGLSLRKYRKPHILLRTMHRFDMPRRDPLHKWLFRKQTDGIITTSEVMKQRIVSRLHIPEGSVKVVFGGVDLERFSPEKDRTPIRDEFGIPHDAPVAGLVARIRKGRGHHWLLRVIPMVLERVPDAHFLIVGRGEMKYPVRAQIDEMAERDHIHPTGYRMEDLPEVYAAMDCSLFLGQGSEGTCRAVLEAMASGRPVVGVRDGGVPEIVEHDRTGLVVDRNDDRGLCDAMCQLLGDLPRAREMGREARRRCEERFTESRRTDSILKAYRKAWKAKYGEDRL